jgi:hypothetical protein
VDKEFHLPIFHKEVIEKKEENDSEKLILKQLENIYEILKTKQSP